MPVLLKIDPLNPDEQSLTEALQILRRGGILAFPTETFYGLGADAQNEAAVDKIYWIKGRDFRNPISIIISDDQYLPSLVEGIPKAASILMQNFWPGPLTLVFWASPSILPRLTGGTGKIGIRVSSHPLARLLAAGLAGQITATSANPSGEPECTTAGAVIQALKTPPDAFIDGGPTPGGMGSTILDVTVSPPRILREGAVTREQILNVLATRQS
jgi:L-threonylcarbamoyladenylate synthase